MKRGIESTMINWIVSKAQDLSKEVACNMIIVEAEEYQIDVYTKWYFEPLEDFEQVI